MSQKTITKSITINAQLDTVWRVFTDPTLTSKMGGKYVTDWKVGSDFGWMGNDGASEIETFIKEHKNRLDIK